MSGEEEVCIGRRWSRRERRKSPSSSWLSQPTLRQRVRKVEWVDLTDSSASGFQRCRPGTPQSRDYAQAISTRVRQITNDLQLCGLQSARPNLHARACMRRIHVE